MLIDSSSAKVILSMYPMLQFEREIDPDQSMIPLAVRMKLDLCGRRISLKDWSTLDPEQKSSLLLAPAETAADVASFEHKLVIALGGTVPPPADSDCSAWERPGPVPGAVSTMAGELALELKWRSLDRFGRYVLNHLASRGAADKFGAALREIRSRVPRDTE